LREPAPLSAVLGLSSYPWLVVGVTCIGAFIGQVDASIVQIALPALERNFHATLASVSWVAIAYMLAFAATLPAFARLSEISGRKLPYIFGYAIFTGASLLCGMAGSLAQLIFFRLLQGAGGALLGANSLTILASAAGPHRRGRALGLFATAQAIGVSVGPVAGGLLLRLDWRWVFWVSVPFGVAGTVLGWLLLPQTADVASGKRFDWRGALLLSPALASVVVWLSEFRDWPLAWIAALAAASAALGALFVWRERRVESPLIDLRLFGAPAFTGGVAGVSLSYALLYAMFFLMSFAFVRGFDESSFSSGLRLAVVPVCIGLVAPIAGKFYESLGPRKLTTTGMALSGAGIALAWLGLNGAKPSLLALAGGLAVFGAGLGLYIAPNNSATIAAAGKGRTGEAGGLLSLMRVLGSMAGVVTASTALSLRLHPGTGSGSGTLSMAGHTVVEAVQHALWVLLLFAVVAGCTGLFRVPETDGAADK
jgi:EmrB/QacA subfamily drug resistance transporter